MVEGGLAQSDVLLFGPTLWAVAVQSDGYSWAELSESSCFFFFVIFFFLKRFFFFMLFLLFNEAVD